MSQFFDRPFSKAIASITIGALLAGVALYFIFPSSKVTRINAKDLAMKAVMQDGGGVAADSPFILSSSGSLDIDQVKALLAVQPHTELNFTKKSDKEIEVSAKEKLQPNHVYQFSIPTQDQKASWAFQVKGEFHSINTLPGNQATNVPLNTGIEVTFTHETYKDFEKYFSISPSVPGAFERHKRTTAFVPSKPLAPKTIYTVIVKKGLPLEKSDLKLEDELTFQFETTASDNGKLDYFELSTDQTEWSTTADQTILFRNGISKPTTVGSTIPAPQQTIAVAAYKMNNKNTYVTSYEKLINTTYWATFNRYQLKDILSSSAKVKELTAPIQYDNYQSFINLPEKLEKGYYLLAITLPDIENMEPRYMWVQVTPLATYVQLNQNDAVFWVNSTDTKSAVKGAKITFSDGSSAMTDATGVAKLSLPQTFYEKADPKNTSKTNQNSIHAEVTVNGEATVLFLDKYRPQKNLAKQYYTYGYTDRPTYQPTDTVNFWGVIKPKAGAPSLNAATAQLTSTSYLYGDYFGYDDSDVVLQEQSIKITPLGTFTGSWNIKDMATGCHNIQIKSGDTVYQQTYFCIEQYVKPAYTIDVKTSKEEAMVGEKIDVQIYAHFFEGTPVPFKKIVVEASAYDGQNQTFNLTTDKSGHASFSYQPPEEVENTTYTSYWPKNIQIQARPLSQEEGEIIGERNISVYGPDMVMSTTQSSKDGNKLITVQLNRLDIPKDDDKGAPLANYSVQGKVVETTYNRIVTGKSYDFISKTTIDKVDYVKNESITKEFSLTTDTQGKATFSMPFVAGKDVQVKFEVQAPNKRLVRKYEYLYNNQEYAYYFLTTNKDTNNYTIGEAGSVTITKESGPAQDDKYLFLVTTEKSTDYLAQTSPVMNFKFLEKMIPSANIDTVRFTGETYVYAGSATVSLDTAKERTLKIDVTSDKKSYQPGDQVQLHVHVAKNGKGVATDTNISLVDEAYFEIYPHTADPLSNLYATYGRFQGRSSYTYMTHNIVLQGGGGAEGGGGGGDARSVFPDTALFRTITTNGNGDGDISFKLPDSITSWKITTQSFDENVDAGVEYTTLPVSLPFFTDAVVAKDYLAADKPVVELRTFGEKLAANVPVTFTVSSSLSDEKKIISAKSYNNVSFALPALKVGKQTITIAAEAAGMKDTLVRQFNVISSRITAYDIKTVKAVDMKSVPAEVLGAKGDVTITIQETEKARMYNELWRASYATGARFDQVAASEMALKMLKENFKEQDLPDSGDVTSGLGDIYQDSNGGVKLLPYASADLELSARAAILAPEMIDQKSLREYFINILNEEAKNKYPKATRERYIMALSGLAALKDPVLTTIQNLSKETDLSPIEELYLAAGAMSIGDQGTAQTLAQDMLNKYRDNINPYIRLKIGKDNDDILRHTALFTVIAADLNLPELEGLSTYVTEQAGKDIVVDLEKIAAVARRVGIVKAGDTEVTYSINGIKTTKTLTNGDFAQVNVPAQVLPNFAIENAKGDLSVTFLYQHGANKENLKKDANIGITKTFKVNGKVVTSWSASDMVIVVLTAKFGPQSVDSCYSITDNLPSGLKPLSWQVSLGAAEKNLDRPYVIQGQQTRFCLSKNSKPIQFPTRVINKGSFVSEPTVIQISDRPGSVNASDETMVTIQ